MPLPNISAPEFKTVLPSNRKDVFYRPFLVKEEKILLMALQGGEEDEINNAVLQIMKNCVKLDEQEIVNLPYYDIEYLFLQLRSKSIENIINLNLRHRSEIECEHVTKYELNLDEVNVEFIDKHTNKIMLTDSVGVVMRYPTISNTSDIASKLNDENIENIFEFIASSIETVFDNETVYEDHTHKELLEFISNLNKDQFLKIIEFYNTMPALRHTIEYTCEQCGEAEKIELRGLQSFFT